MEEVEKTIQKEISQQISAQSPAASFGIPKEDFEAMLESGIYWGHLPSKVHPKMREYIEGLKSNVTVIDLRKIYQGIEKAKEYLEEKMKENPDFTILLVGTTPPAREPVLKMAQKFDFPYVIQRWIGGTFTNFQVISQRLKYFRELEEQKEKGELKKYSRKEQLDFERELKRLYKNFGGIKMMEKLPDLLLVINVSFPNHQIAIKEANKVGIPVMAMVDVDGNPEPIDIVIPGNDESKKAIEFVLNKLSEVIEKYRKPKEEPQEPQEKET